MFRALTILVVSGLVQYANILQGTGSTVELSHGNTIPCVMMPHGVHAWSAQTGKKGTGQKYEFRADRIVGFDQTHQCNTWMNDYAVFALMPELGEPVVDEQARGALFSHDDEYGQPNYYSVQFANGIRTEIAPTERCAHLRFSFPAKGGDAVLVLDGNVGESSVEIDPEHRQIRGWAKNHPWGSPGVNPAKDGLVEYFILQFDKPFTSWGTWEGVDNTLSEGDTAREGERVGAWLKFRRGAKVQVRVAGSYVSAEQARVNFDREIASDTKLEQTRERGAKVWNDLFGRMRAEGGSEEELRTFYSCLFRASCFPRMAYDIREDGMPVYFSPWDGLVHEGYMYTDNGHWDSFRSHMPLNVLLFPTYQQRYVVSLLDAHDQHGWFPAWSAPGETGVMLGNHASTIFADAWAKGLRGFDPKRALEGYLHDVTNASKWSGSVGRGESEYYELGYIPFRSAVGAVAKTLEYCFDDFCAWKLAGETGNDFYAGIFSRQLLNYRNVFDKSDNFMKGRLADGTFDPTFSPYRWGSLFAPGDYCEGNAWHWTWSVFHDVQGLIDLFGSDEVFVAKMDSVFTLPPICDFSEYGTLQHEMAEMIEADMGQYCHGNQPIQHMPYLYTYAGQPWKTQRRAREICRRLYHSGPDGYPGDEDQGSSSAWYVWSAMGLFPVTPGVDQYVIGSPVFGRMTLTLEDGKVFTVEAEGNSPDNVYIQSATLNGEALDRNWLTHEEVISGGVLHLVMGPQPNEKRGTTKDAAPYSMSR